MQLRCDWRLNVNVNRDARIVGEKRFMASENTKGRIFSRIKGLRSAFNRFGRPVGGGAAHHTEWEGKTS